MISYFQAIILGLLQGVSELFPISSLGHSVILPGLLEWHIQQNDQFFISFLVATHLATAIVLFLFFWKDWVRIIKGILQSLQEREIKTPDAKLGWLLIVGTIPAGILGLLLEEPLRSLFASPKSAAFFLILNGVLLFGAEFLRRKRNEKNESLAKSDQRLAKLSWTNAINVGTLQAIALLPGFSRTGATIAGSLLVGLNHEDAVRYSFLLATPIIGAAAMLKIPDMLTGPGRNELPQAIVGALCAGVAAYFAVKFLTKYFQTKTLIPFAVYCLTAGILSSVILLFK